jgi:tRNA threonylcarbamoyladenosine biosynthesis protein TsaB
MSLILNIDTAIENGSVCLAKNDIVIAVTENSNQRDHASWIHMAIQKLLTDNGYKLTDLDSVAVSSGPGSYTGLRVGLSTAKGLCYALNIPLITINTLELMAFSAKDQAIELISPMIDARRMEVFTAVYNKNMQEIVAPQACILEKDLFSELLKKQSIIFFGNGARKFKPLVQSPNADFPQIETNACHLADISYKFFEKRQFADLAYAEPFYLKGFFTPVKAIN